LNTMNTSTAPVTGNPEKAKRINPWIGIWWDQRTTLVHVWQNLLEDYIHRLFMLAGLAFMLAARLPDWSAIAPHPIGVMVQILLFAPLGGLVAGYVFAAILRTIGNWMGKSVPSAHTKSMVAWSNLPFVGVFAVFLISFLLLDRVQGPLHLGQIWLFKGMLGWLPLALAAPIYLWAIVVRVRSIMVLLGVDAGRATFAWFTTTMLTFVPAAGFIYLYLVLYYISSTAGG
jgi:hypothetical protein